MYVPYSRKVWQRGKFGELSQLTRFKHLVKESLAN